MGATFGRYVLDRWLAQGGMANIFLATYAGPLGFEREVVLKVILPDFAHNPGFISMFLDEARLAARLNHPNIVQVHDLGQVGGYLFIAMEYVRGPSLSRLVTRARKQGRRIPVQLAIFIVSELLEALSYAHLRRDRDGQPLHIVHRDVNPQNVLVSFDGQVKLTDFGVAKARSNLYETRPGVVIGKYSHMAPEQVSGQPVDERADVFAVGTMLYELLTEKALFLRPSALEMARAILEEPVLIPSTVSERCPPELDLVVMKALARRPEDRFPSALAMLDSLQRMAHPTGLLATRYDLRTFLDSLYHLSKTNLAGNEEPGIEVTEERVMEILRGLHQQKPRVERSNGGLTTSGARSTPGVVRTDAGADSKVGGGAQVPAVASGASGTGALPTLGNRNVRPSASAHDASRQPGASLPFSFEQDPLATLERDTTSDLLEDTISVVAEFDDELTNAWGELDLE